MLLTILQGTGLKTAVPFLNVSQGGERLPSSGLPTAQPLDPDRPGHGASTSSPKALGKGQFLSLLISKTEP